MKSPEGLEYKMNVYELNSNQENQNISGDGIYTKIYGFSTEDMTSSSMARGDMTDDIWDSTQSVGFYIKLTWDSLSGKYKLMNVKGWVDFASSTISLSKNKVQYGCNSIYEGIQQRDELTFSGSTFDVDTGFTNYVSNIAGAVMGCSWSAVLNRSTSFWPFEGELCIFNNDPAFFG